VHRGGDGFARLRGRGGQDQLGLGVRSTGRARKSADENARQESQYALHRDIDARIGEKFEIIFRAVSFYLSSRVVE
jgi:hypothetical protein